MDGPDGLALQDFPEPEGAHPLAGDDRLLIEVHAAGVAFPDLLQSRGEYQFAVPPPFVTGGEVSGVVVEAPDGSGFAPGDRVAGMTIWGAMAEYALAIPRYTVKLPDDDVVRRGRGAVAELLDRAGSRSSAPGSRGARPSSSTAPPAASARRRSTSCAGLGRARSRSSPTDEKERVARGAGAHEVVRSTGCPADEVRGLTDGRGVEVVLDPVGGDRFTDSLRALDRPAGWS